MTLRNTHTDLFKYVFHSGSDKVFVAKSLQSISMCMIVNGDWRQTKQPKLTVIIQARWLAPIGNTACMDDNVDARGYC